MRKEASTSINLKMVTESILRPMKLQGITVRAIMHKLATLISGEFFSLWSGFINETVI